MIYLMLLLSGICWICAFAAGSDMMERVRMLAELLELEADDVIMFRSMLLFLLCVWLAGITSGVAIGWSAL